MSTRLFIVAGEVSGDLHGSSLVKELKALDPDIQIEGLGGPLMAAAGCKLRLDIASDGLVGFVEVLKNFPSVRRLMLDTVDYLKKSPPDAVILIDYPGFNLRLAERLKSTGCRIIYYISPQVWAWGKGRVAKIAKLVDKMMVILPFEEDFYKKAGVPVKFVGHPLIDQLSHIAGDLSVDSRRAFDPDSFNVAILPGSRKQELERHLQLLLESAQIIWKRMPGARFTLALPDHGANSPELPKECARWFDECREEDCPPVEIRTGETYDVLHESSLCLVASGTATLEAACFLLPMVVVYRVSPMSYMIARSLVDIKYISLVNLLADAPVVPELIQNVATAGNIASTALELIEDKGKRNRMIDELEHVRGLLGPTGASRVAAETVLSTCNG
ncbi:lipid-A-disaccharide synthase [Candidatus Hydrogenedentota bacterium]